MASNNFERMIQLAAEVFDAHNDSEQLDVNEAVIERLKRLHPATLSEHIEGDGPVVWILLIPTTKKLMQIFLDEKISESELLNRTPLKAKYESLYLCSALVLPEYRRNGLAKQVALGAITQIRRDHPVQMLFAWNFSKEGAMLATRISEQSGLPLLIRRRQLSQQ